MLQKLNDTAVADFGGTGKGYGEVTGKVFRVKYFQILNVMLNTDLYYHSSSGFTNESDTIAVFGNLLR